MSATARRAFSKTSSGIPASGIGTGIHSVRSFTFRVLWPLIFFVRSWL